MVRTRSGVDTAVEVDLVGEDEEAPADGASLSDAFRQRYEDQRKEEVGVVLSELQMLVEVQQIERAPLWTQAAAAGGPRDRVRRYFDFLFAEVKEKAKALHTLEHNGGSEMRHRNHDRPPLFAPRESVLSWSKLDKMCFSATWRSRRKEYERWAKDGKQSLFSRNRAQRHMASWTAVREALHGEKIRKDLHNGNRIIAVLCDADVIAKVERATTMSTWGTKTHCKLALQSMLAGPCHQITFRQIAGDGAVDIGDTTTFQPFRDYVEAGAPDIGDRPRDIASNIADAMKKFGYHVIGVETLVFDPYRTYGKLLFSTRCDFVAMRVVPNAPLLSKARETLAARGVSTKDMTNNRIREAAREALQRDVIVGDYKTRWGTKSQRNFNELKEWRQVLVNAYFTQLITGVCVTHVALVYANLNDEVVIMERPFHGEYVRKLVNALLWAPQDVAYAEKTFIVHPMHETRALFGASSQRRTHSRSPKAIRLMMHGEDVPLRPLVRGAATALKYNADTVSMPVPVSAHRASVGDAGYDDQSMLAFNMRLHVTKNEGRDEKDWYTQQDKDFKTWYVAKLTRKDAYLFTREKVEWAPLPMGAAPFRDWTDDEEAYCGPLLPAETIKLTHAYAYASANANAGDTPDPMSSGAHANRDHVSEDVVLHGTRRRALSAYVAARCTAMEAALYDGITPHMLVHNGRAMRRSGAALQAWTDEWKGLAVEMARGDDDELGRADPHVAAYLRGVAAAQQSRMSLLCRAAHVSINAAMARHYAPMADYFDNDQTVDVATFCTRSKRVFWRFEDPWLYLYAHAAMTEHVHRLERAVSRANALYAARGGQ